MKPIDERYLESARAQITKLSPMTMFFLRGEVGDTHYVPADYGTANVTEMARKYGMKVSVKFVLAIHEPSSVHPEVEKIKAVTIMSDDNGDDD